MLIKNSKSIADLTAKVEENTNNITFNNTIAMENPKVLSITKIYR